MPSDSLPGPAAAVTPDATPTTLTLPPVASPPVDSTVVDGRLVVAVSIDPHRGVTFDPVIFLPKDGDPSPYPAGLDTGLVAFQQVYATPTRVYTVLEAGRPIGVLHPTGAHESSCVGFTGDGVLEPPRSGPWGGLAVTGTLATSPWSRRELTVSERAALARLARPLLLGLDATAAGADSAVVDRGFAYQAGPDSAPLLAAALHRDEPRSQGYQERLSIFLIAQAGPDGPTATFTWAHGGVEEGRQERGFLDAADLDEDGELDFVTSISYYESLEYRIVRASGGEWPVGASAGC